MIITFITAAGQSVAFASTVLATPVLNFIIDGDTFSNPFTFTNNSTEGEQIVAFGIDLAGTGLVFDTVNGGVPNTTDGFPFTPLRNSDTLTGLIGTPVVADGASSFSLAFDDFDVGESFVFQIDVDPNTTSLFAG